MSLRINFNLEVAYIDKKSYVGSTSFTSGQNGFWINRDFLMSKDFDKLLLKILFKYYSKEFENFMIENEGFDCSFGQINYLLDTIEDINLIKYIAKERDGFINQITLPTDKNGDPLDGDDWNNWYKENLKLTDIIFVNY